MKILRKAEAPVLMDHIPMAQTRKRGKVAWEYCCQIIAAYAPVGKFF